MKRNSSKIFLILVGLAGILVVCVLAVVAAVSLFRISSSMVSAAEPAQAKVEVVVVSEGTQTLTGEEDSFTEEPASVEPLPADQAVTPEPGSGVIAPPGFNAFIDDPLHFGIALPAEWEEGQRYLDYSRIFYSKDPNQEGVGPLPILYVTLIPQDDSLAEGSYSYMSNETIRSFMVLPVGETQPLVPDAVLPEYITFTRLPDQQVGGQQVVVLENDQVWEAPQETIERRTLIVTEAGTFIIGTFYETPEELTLFGEVLATFQFLS